MRDSRRSSFTGCAVVILTLLSGPVFAVECNKRIMEQHKPFGPVGPASQVVEKFKNYEVGRPFVVAVGRPLIRGQVLRQDKTYQFAQDVIYKPSWILSYTYRFKAGVAMPAGRIKTPEGEFDFVTFSNNSSISFLFINDQGQLCDRVSVFYESDSNSTLIAGTYTATPDIPATSAVGASDDAGIGDVIILSAFDGIGVTLTSRKSVNGQLQQAKQTTYDASTGEMSIDGYRVKVSAQGSQQITAVIIAEPDTTAVWNSAFDKGSS